MFKAKRPCKFGYRQFYVGDEIPAELIDPNRVNTLIKYGTIESVPEPAAETPEMPPEPSGTETGTNTSTDKENGSQGDKQALNEAKPAPGKRKAQAQPAKKGGK